MNNLLVVSQSVTYEIGKQLIALKKGLELAGQTKIKVQDILTDGEHQFITDKQLEKIEKSLNVNEPITENTVIFSQAAARTNVVSGEKLSILFGKVMKFLADLKTIAFTGSYTDLSNRPALGGAASQAVVNNCTTTASGSVLDARQGQVLQANINTVNNSLTSNVNSITGTWLGNNKISFDGINFYATASNGVKKKLGNYEVVTITDGVWITNGIQFSLTSITNYKELALYREIFPVITGYYSNHTGATSAPLYTYASNTGILTIVTNNASIGKPNYATIYVIK